MYCNECKRKFDVPVLFRIPKVTDPKRFTEVRICPNCKSENITSNESEVNKA